jgi:hypothetical protein
MQRVLVLVPPRLVVAAPAVVLGSANSGNEARHTGRMGEIAPDAVQANRAESQ